MLELLPFLNNRFVWSSSIVLWTRAPEKQDVLKCPHKSVQSVRKQAGAWPPEKPLSLCPCCLYLLKYLTSEGARIRKSNRGAELGPATLNGSQTMALAAFERMVQNWHGFAKNKKTTWEMLAWGYWEATTMTEWYNIRSLLEITPSLHMKALGFSMEVPDKILRPWPWMGSVCW